MKTKFVVIYSLAVCMICLWAFEYPATKFPTTFERKAINAADVDRFSTLGLGEPQKIRELAKLLCKIGYDDYSDSLPTKLERALADALNSTMPAPTIAFYGDRDAWAAGRFLSRTWTIELNSKLISRKNLTDLLIVLTHELRHAEQYYIAIKYHLKSGHSYDDIKSFLHSPSHIVEYASNNLIALDSDELAFGQFMSSVFFSNEINNKRRKIKSDIRKSKDKNEIDIYTNMYRNELPRERDANSVQRFLKHAIEDCLPRKQR